MSDTAEEWCPVPPEPILNSAEDCEVCGEQDWQFTETGWMCRDCKSEYSPDGSLMFRGDNQAKGEAK